MPRLNEAETLANCIQQAQKAIEQAGFGAEIIVAANGSTDGSQVIVKELGVRVVPIATRGYGSALIGGIAAACGRFTQQCDQGMAPDSIPPRNRLSEVLPAVVLLAFGTQTGFANFFISILSIELR